MALSAGMPSLRWARVAAFAAMFAGAPLMADADPPAFLPPPPAWSGASERLIAPADHPWLTDAEASGLTASPDYATTLAWLERLAAASPLIRLETFGATAQGRPLVAAIVTRDGATLDPAKPVLLAQAGIHSGEIDGKDAGLMLLRDIAFRGRADLVEAVNIVFIPVLNADGHERSSPTNRPNQRGPVSQGWRNTAQNLNLNRDYMKADAPEMQALLGLINRYDPTLYLDLHVTDGMDYQYDITYGFDGWNGVYADSPQIGGWLNNTLRPTLDTALADAGHIPGPLIFARDESDIVQGIDFMAFSPRFSHAYGDLRGLPTVLVENHSLKPYRQRVLGTYVLIEACIHALADHGAELKTAMLSDRARRPRKLPANWKTAADPLWTMDFLTIDSTRVASVAAGADVTRWTGQPGPAIPIPVYGSEPGVEIDVAAAYWVPVTKPDVIARLRAHGVHMEILSQARDVEVEMLRLAGFRVGQPSEGRTPVAVADITRERRTESFPAGSVRVSTDQPLGALAAMLLEPQGEDSFFAWGFFNETLQRVEYMERYAIAPMAEAMLEADPDLKAEFEQRLAEDDAFAASPLRRLQFFYERSPYYDDRYLLYPVGREPAPQ